MKSLFLGEAMKIREQINRMVQVIRLRGLEPREAETKVKDHIESMIPGSEVVWEQSWSLSEVVGCIRGVVHHPDHKWPIWFEADL